MVKQKSVEDLGRVRGWLLVWVVLLIPHGIGGLVVLFLPEFRAAAHIEGLGLATLVVVVTGNLGGILLILSRNRIAPLFFTIYPPLLLTLGLLDRDLLGTVNARFAAMGAMDGISSVQLTVLVAANIVIVVLMVGYWNRSRRVQAVFGSTGLQMLRTRNRE